MFSVGLQNTTVCNGVAKLGVTSAGHLGALCSPTSSSSSMSPSQDPYTFLDTPSQSPSCLYAPLKISNIGDQYNNGHSRIVNGDIRNKLKKNSGVVSVTKTLPFKVNVSQTATSVLPSVVRDSSLISSERLVNHNNIIHDSPSVNYNNIVKSELPDEYGESMNIVMKCEVDCDDTYLNRTFDTPSVQHNLNNYATPHRKLPTGKPHPSHHSLHLQQEHRRRLDKALLRTPGVHESLQRTDQEEDELWHAPGSYAFDYDLCTIQRLDRNRFDVTAISTSACSQKTWFSSHLQQAVGVVAGAAGGQRSIPRDLRLSLKRALFRRQAEQETAALRCALQESAELNGGAGAEAALRGAGRAAREALLRLAAQRRSEESRDRYTASRLLAPSARLCGAPPGDDDDAADDFCSAPALPCTPYCSRHVARCSEQQLFRHCTAKFADNTQCAMPVFDISHELPLCREHALKRDNYNKMNAESKPKKTPRKRPKPSAMIRPQKRNKKRKRQATKLSPSSSNAPMHEEITEFTDMAACETSSACESSEDAGGVSEIAEALSETELPGQDQIVEQVLSFAPEIASRLLEETDFTNVLNQIPPDAFNDLFAVEQEGQYEPNMEETEELERALEAVDEEVKSLEKLTSAHSMLMDGLLDDRCIAETLAQLG